MDISDDNKIEEKKIEENPMKIPGKAVQLIDEKPFKSNDEMPEAELYFGGEREPESERDLRLIKICQQEEMKRL